MDTTMMRGSRVCKHNVAEQQDVDRLKTEVQFTQLFNKKYS